MSDSDPIHYAIDDGVVTITINRPGAQERPLGRGDERSDRCMGARREGSAGEGGDSDLGRLRRIFRRPRPQAGRRDQGARRGRYSHPDARSHADRHASRLKADHRGDDGIVDGGRDAAGDQVRPQGRSSRNARRNHRGQDGTRIAVGGASALDVAATGADGACPHGGDDADRTARRVRVPELSGRYARCRPRPRHATCAQPSSRARRCRSRRQRPAYWRRWIWVARRDLSRRTGCMSRPMQVSTPSKVPKRLPKSASRFGRADRRGGSG